MKTTALTVAVALALAGCGGTEDDPATTAADPAVSAPEVSCDQRWLHNVPTDDGRFCSEGVIVVRYCQRTYPPSPPPDACAAMGYTTTPKTEM